MECINTCAIIIAAYIPFYSFYAVNMKYLLPKIILIKKFQNKLGNGIHSKFKNVRKLKECPIFE